MPRHPPEKDRRSSERQKPAYTPKEIQELQVTRVHFREDFLFCLLSDGNMACVPLAISPKLLRAPRRVRYQWRIEEQGRTILWATAPMGVVTERLSLSTILEHPEAQITQV